MVKKQVHCVVVASHSDSPLPVHKREPRAKFQQKLLDLAQDGRFDVPLGVGVTQAKKIQDIGIAKNHVRCDPVCGTQGINFSPNQLPGFLGQCRALKKHPVDFVTQGSDAPTLEAAHLGIEIPLEGIFEGDQRDKVGPAQLSYQRYDNLPVSIDPGELQHAAQVFL